MQKFSNLETVREQVIEIFPNEITVFVSINKGGNEFLNNKICYRFLMSEKGTLRNEKLLKRNFENTKAIYQQIWSDFFSHKQMVSFAFDEKKLKLKYSGFKLQNNRGEKLNIYFAPYLKELYSDTLKELKIKKREAFYEYAKMPITKKVVNKFTIRPSSGNHSKIVYVFNDYDYFSTYHKEEQLGYYYQKENGVIDASDIETILNLIYLYINCNINSGLQYGYLENHKYQTIALYIYNLKGNCIEILDVDLIHYIEKAGVIDDLAGMRDRPEIVYDEEKECIKLERTLN